MNQEQPKFTEEKERIKTVNLPNTKASNDMGYIEIAGSEPANDTGHIKPKEDDIIAEGYEVPEKKRGQL